MARNIKIGNTTYAIPSQGQDAPWGQPLSDAIIAMADILRTVSGPSDINLSEGIINNNQTTAIPITATQGRNLQFNDTTVIAAEITYLVQRSDNGNTNRQYGKFFMVKDNGVWNLLELSTSGDSGVTFSVSVASGLARVVYQSTNLNPGTGKIYYSAKAISTV
jgi:hypothetical protein